MAHNDRRNRMGGNTNGKQVRDTKAGELGPVDNKVKIDIQRGNLDIVQTRLLALISNTLVEMNDRMKKKDG